MGKKINCGRKFLFPSNDKILTRKCACECNKLNVIDPTKTLSDACISDCNDNYRDVGDSQDWMCRNYNPDALWSLYNIKACGFKIENTDEFKQHLTEMDNKAKSDKNKMQIVKVGAVMLMVVMVLVFLK